MSEDRPLFDIAQLYSGTKVNIDRNRDVFLREDALALIKEYCLMPSETPQDLFARIAMEYSDGSAHAQRLYDYMSNLWFLPSWEVLNKSSLNISCYLNEAEDSLQSILDVWNENVWASSRGVSVSSYWGGLRALGENVGENGRSSGVIPFVKAQEAISSAINKGGAKAATIYLPINHPEIEGFLELAETKTLHIAILISDAFMRAVEGEEDWALISPKDETIKKTVKACALWENILQLRQKYSEPYLIFIDNVNKAAAEHHKLAGLNIKMSDSETDVMLPTGRDNYNQERAATLCKAVVNLVKFEEWENHPQFIEDIMRFLDNLLTNFIKAAPDTMIKAKYAAMRERSVGLGVMGLASFFEKKDILFGSVNAKMWNKRIFKYLKEAVDSGSIKLARERGACLDAREYGLQERFSYKMSVSNTAKLSQIAGDISSSINPLSKDIDARDIVEMAADRAQFICQSQALTLYIGELDDIDSLHMLHYHAWKSGVKSLYLIENK